jgi:flagellar assembly protein FliH
MTMHRRVIPGGGSGETRTWEPPAVSDAGGGVIGGRRSGPRPMTASQLESVHGQAFAEGFAQGEEEGRKKGYQEGLARARAEIGSQGELLASILHGLSRPLEAVDQEVEDLLASLAMGVARHLVRRELKADPGQVIAVVREAVSALPSNAREVRLHLHPEDALLVRATLGVIDGEGTWEIVEDPVLTRGGCRVVTDISQVDATVEHRLASVIARVMGEERER